MRLYDERDADSLVVGEPVWWLHGASVYPSRIVRVAGEWEREDGKKRVLGYYVAPSFSEEPQFASRHDLFRMANERGEVLEAIRSRAESLEGYYDEIKAAGEVVAAPDGAK